MDKHVCDNFESVRSLTASPESRILDQLTSGRFGRLATRMHSAGGWDIQVVNVGMKLTTNLDASLANRGGCRFWVVPDHPHASMHHDELGEPI